MTTPPVNPLATSFAGFLAQNIFPGIITGMSARGTSTSVEELLLMTGAPNVSVNVFANGPKPVTPIASPFPGMAFSGPPNTAVPAAVIEGRCPRIMSRGKRKHQVCGGKINAGNTLCNACTKVGSKKEGGSTPGVLSGTIAGGMVPLGQIANIPEVADEESEEPEETGAPQISVAVFDEAQGLHRELVHGFIVKDHGAGKIMVYGKAEASQREILPLTDLDKVQVLEMGMHLV